MMHRIWLWFAGAALVSLIGCKTATRAPGASDDYFGPTLTCIDHDGDGFGLNCTLGADCDDSNATVTIGCYICDHPSPGCPCSTENARSQCGTLTGQEGTQTTCSYGESVCTGGSWGACAIDGKTVKTFNSAKRTQGLASAAPCGIACDPYCQQFPDTPDDTLSTPEGLLGTDAGLTLEQTDAHIRPYLPNGPMPGYIQETLRDGGIFADAQPDAMIYHELPPGETAQDTVAGTNVVPPRSIDVYFLENNAGTMKLTEQAVLNTVPVAGGTVDQVRATVPDARFGVGRFGTYGGNPWNFGLGSPTVAFEHVLSPTIDNVQLTTGLQYAVTKNIVAAANPRTWVQALFSIATTAGLPSSNAASPWVLARADWSSPIGTGEAGPCANGGVGYPCFRPSASAIPVTVVLTDTPSLNGPGGQYALARNSAWNVDGAKYWPPVGTPVTGNSTEATAYVIDPTVWGTYSGDTTAVGNLKNSKWDGGHSANECVVDRGLNARNVFFTFTLAQRTWYHFDVQDSAFNAVVYLYKNVGGVITWIACNEALSLGDPQFMPLSINGVLDPGQYYVVVDGNAGAEGKYVLHVNAMPDGPPFTAPNYDEALAAYTAIGGKVVGVDASGYGCNVAPHINAPNWMQQNTGNALQKLLLDTGSVDGGNNPYLISLSNWGDACHAGDPAFATKLAQNILDVTGSARALATRGDVTAVVLDSDDAIDFDGPPGGPNRLTPTNVDDTTFVTSITTVSTPETLANCTQIQANQYVGCTTGTPVTFNVNIQTPATIPLLYHDQVFTFVVRILANGTRVLSDIPFVVVVPALWPYLSDAWFVRDFDTTTVCPLGTAPVWGTWAWNATTPLDSRIDFDVSVASTAAGLSTPGNPIDSLLFSSTPMSLVGTAIGAHNDLPNGGLDTQLGATYVDWTLANPPSPAPAGTIRSRDSKALRIRSHLIPTSDYQFAPTLNNWNLSVSCVPAE